LLPGSCKMPADVKRRRPAKSKMCEEERILILTHLLFVPKKTQSDIHRNATKFFPIIVACHKRRERRKRFYNGVAKGL